QNSNGPTRGVPTRVVGRLNDLWPGVALNMDSQRSAAGARIEDHDRCRHGEHTVPREWLIERVAVDKHFGREIERWKQLRDEGWDLTVLVPVLGEVREAIAMGWR